MPIKCGHGKYSTLEVFYIFPHFPFPHYDA